jgi:hypothetical protein
MVYGKYLRNFQLDCAELHLKLTSAASVEKEAGAADSYESLISNLKSVESLCGG